MHGEWALPRGGAGGEEMCVWTEMGEDWAEGREGRRPGHPTPGGVAACATTLFASAAAVLTSMLKM